MKEHPILFSREMVLAILEGRKTQTRRVIKHQPDSVYMSPKAAGYSYQAKYGNETKTLAEIADLPYADYDSHPHLYSSTCPFGSAGDKLWVRETWSTSAQWNDTKPSMLPFTGTDDGCIFYAADYEESDLDVLKPLRPAIFLPRRYSRITLEITDVRVGRLNDISEDDAISEGMYGEYWHGATQTRGNKYGYTAQSQFRDLWNSINGKDSWAANPYIWAISFKVLEPSR